MFLRLSADVNERLRELLRYRGDLSFLVEEALTKADLTNVTLLHEVRTGAKQSTTATVNEPTGIRLKAAATVRRCSANTLANSAISAWLESPKLQA